MALRTLLAAAAAAALAGAAGTALAAEPTAGEFASTATRVATAGGGRVRVVLEVDSGTVAPHLELLLRRCGAGGPQVADRRWLAPVAVAGGRFARTARYRVRSAAARTTTTVEVRIAGAFTTPELASGTVRIAVAIRRAGRPTRRCSVPATRWQARLAVPFGAEEPAGDEVEGASFIEEEVEVVEEVVVEEEDPTAAVETDPRAEVAGALAVLLVTFAKR